MCKSHLLPQAGSTELCNQNLVCNFSVFYWVLVSEVEIKHYIRQTRWPHQRAGRSWAQRRRGDWDKSADLPMREEKWMCCCQGWRAVHSQSKASASGITHSTGARAPGEHTASPEASWLWMRVLVLQLCDLGLGRCLNLPCLPGE